MNAKIKKLGLDTSLKAGILTHCRQDKLKPNRKPPLSPFYAFPGSKDTKPPLEKHISRAMGNALKIPIVAAGKVARQGKGKAAVTGGLTHISG